jgi:hypothetical protein
MSNSIFRFCGGAISKIWKINFSSAVEGMTQMSYFSSIDGDDVANFSHPFTLDLFFDINRLDQVEIL